MYKNKYTIIGIIIIIIVVVIIKNCVLNVNTVGSRWIETL